MFYKDSRLSWNPAEWDNVSQLNLDASEVWIPDIVPYNGEQVRPQAITFRDDTPKVQLLQYHFQLLVAWENLCTKAT
jgi:hypothetical protein